MSVGSVAVAVVDDMPLYEVAIACEVFGPKRLSPWYALRLCALEPGRTRTESGFVPHTEHRLDRLVDADTVIIPAVPHECLRTDRPLPGELIDAVRAAARAGARMVSLCSGAFVLAEAG